jgi:hypothetical protein
LSTDETEALRKRRNSEYVAAWPEFVIVFFVELGFARVNGWSISVRERACWLWEHADE